MITPKDIKPLPKKQQKLSFRYHNHLQTNKGIDEYQNGREIRTRIY